MTFDTWTDGMFALMRGVSGYAWIYFVTIAFLGGNPHPNSTPTPTPTPTPNPTPNPGLFVVNLFLCVIFDEFIKSQVR